MLAPVDAEALAGAAGKGQFFFLDVFTKEKERSHRRNKSLMFNVDNVK